MSYTNPNVINNEEYDEPLRLYYNGLDFTKAINPIKQKRSWYNPEVAKEMMLEGEEFERIYIENKRTDHIIITNLGRVINTNTGTISGVWITKHNITVNLGGTSYTYKDIYEDTELEYDYERIKNNFIENKWKIKTVNNKQE